MPSIGFCFLVSSVLFCLAGTASFKKSQPSKGVCYEFCHAALDRFDRCSFGRRLRWPQNIARRWFACHWVGNEFITNQRDILLHPGRFRHLHYGERRVGELSEYRAWETG